MKTYDIPLDYTMTITLRVDAENKEDVIQKAREMYELLSSERNEPYATETSENWVTEVKES